MNQREWTECVAAVNGDVMGIIRAQRVLAQVNRELGARRAEPYEEDAIFSAGYGFEPGAPREVVVDGVTLIVRVLHRKGLRQTDVMGADLIYEVEGRKFALVQYKDAGRDGRVLRDADQLKQLVAACPNACPPSALSFWPTCGSWYRVRSAQAEVFHPACRAQAIFGQAASRSFEHFGSGIPAETFQQLFARCWIGARVVTSELLVHTWASVQADRVLFSVVQRGLFA